MKLENISQGTIIYICALDSMGIDIESIARRLRVDSQSKKTLHIVGIHDIGIIVGILTNWKNRIRQEIKEV